MEDSEDLELLSALIDTFDSDTEETAEAAKPRASESGEDGSKADYTVGNVAARTITSTTPTIQKNSETPGRPVDEFSKFSVTGNETTPDAKDLFGDISEEEDDEMITKTTLNENGSEIKRLMKDREQESVQSSGFYDRTVTTSQIKNKWVNGKRVAHHADDSNSLKIPDVGLSVINPKVSTQFLKQAMAGKELVLLSRIGLRNANIKPTGDWITFGVIASKTESKRSSKGGDYIIFRLADMTNVDVEVSMFLFGRSYENHWKLPVATTIGLMNPGFMKNDKVNTRSVATINIQSESQLLVIGTSKEFGTCGSVTKSGNRCTNIVNRAACDKCRFHTMQQHKASRLKRTELNATFSSKEPSSLLSKLATTRSADDCFTYGGKCYSTKPQKPKTKVSLKGVLNRFEQKGHMQSTLKLYQIKAEDEKRISAAAAAKQTKAEEHLEELISRPTTASMQFVKHLVSKTLEPGNESKDVGLKIASVRPSDLIRREKERLTKQLKDRKRPDSSVNTASSHVELGSSVPKSGATTMTASEYRQLIAKQKAKEIIQKDGGLQKEDVNATRKKLTAKQKEQLKRRLDNSLNSSQEADTEEKKTNDLGEKRVKLNKLDVNSQAYLEIRNKKSINSHLVKQVENERESQYFGAMEKKESYETKLLNTHMIESKIYYCIQCDYQDWSLAKRCFEERHKYRKLPALKRFFRCKDCKERVVTHEKFPTSACKKCGGTNYVKAGMIHEKKVTLAGEELCVRGNEETKLGSYDSSINLDKICKAELLEAFDSRHADISIFPNTCFSR
ncbi:protein MCM10 homolog isoform X2 [Watersipora subatra]|uniref:protein MCM10 homolog isoform X2 n=1 Tax=Watersipora subatra TaxID=2589382 RepID=UPI00355C28C5